MSNVERKIVKGLEDILAYDKGEKSLTTHEVSVPNVDIVSVRKGLQLSQQAFAKRFHVPIGTLRGWEQGRREPDVVARTFLKLIETNPNTVDKLIKEAHLSA